MEDYARQIIAALVLALRVAPTLAFAPPFTLIRIPALVRLALAVAIGMWLVGTFPDQTWRHGFPDGVVTAIACELFLGIMLALALQIAFAALLTAGRTVDIQAGFGLSMLIDPTTKAQMPLAGTLLSYAAGIIFFLTTGPGDLLALLARSLQGVPIGAAGLTGRLEPILAFTGTAFLIAFGAVGLLMLALFVVDGAIALMSRTLPQMNVMLMGFQVKTLVVLLLLPLAIGLGAGLLLRLVRSALELMTRLT